MAARRPLVGHFTPMEGGYGRGSAATSTFLDADEVQYLQSEVSLEEVRARCAAVGLSTEGDLAALRVRFCAHVGVPLAGGAGGAGQAATLSRPRQGSAPPPLLGTTDAPPRTVVRAGWLDKKGGETYVDSDGALHKDRHYGAGGRRNWKSRWFVLFSDGEMHYYENPPADRRSVRLGGPLVRADQYELPAEEDWKGRVQLVGVEAPFVGQPCCWHVHHSAPDQLLLSLPSGSGARRNGLLLRCEDESERMDWVAATVHIFGSTVAPLLYTAEQLVHKANTERLVESINSTLARHCEEARAMARKLPPTQAVVKLDFPPVAPALLEGTPGLAFTKGATVVLTRNEGDWWHGHLAGAPQVVSKFPASYVLSGQGQAQPAMQVVLKRCRIVKGPNGYGMGIRDDGWLENFTRMTNNPAEYAGAPLWTYLLRGIHTSRGLPKLPLFWIPDQF